MGILGSLFGGGKQSSESGNKAYDFLKGELGGAIGGGVNFMNALRDELSGGFEGYKKKAGFDFQLGEGLRGISGSRAALGGLRSGDTGRAAINFGNNLQSGMYENYLNRLTGAGDQGLTAASILSGAGQTSTSKGKDYGGGIVNSLFSDRRLKREIQRIGTADNGLPIYAYEYTNKPGVVHLGFMADEVEALHPEAISEFMGYKTVDYGKAVL